MVRFVAVGELLVDVLADGSGHDARIRARPGGSAFNAAATAAAAGARAAVVGTVGDDAAGRMIVAELELRGIESNVACVDGETGVFLLADGEIAVDRGAGRAPSLPHLIDADAVLVSGYLAPETIATALERSNAAWVALDAARLTDLPAGGNTLVANEDAARRLTGQKPESAVRMLGERYRLCCVTLGAQGAVAVMDGRLETVRPAKIFNSDPPGAGDAFAAALLVALARGLTLAEALAEACRWGARAAAISSPA